HVTHARLRPARQREDEIVEPRVLRLHHEPAASHGHDLSHHDGIVRAPRDASREHPHAQKQFRNASLTRHSEPSYYAVELPPWCPMKCSIGSLVALLLTAGGCCTYHFGNDAGSGGDVDMLPPAGDDGVAVTPTGDGGAL